MNSTDESQLLSERERSRLRWRCRRGLLESEIIINRWLDTRLNTLTVQEANTFNQLLALADNDLLDLLLGKTTPQQELDTPAVHQLLQELQQTLPEKTIQR